MVLYLAEALKSGRELAEDFNKQVRVICDRGRLMLRFTTGGRRYRFYLRLPDSKQNRRLAEAKATQIEWDIRSNNFDPTLEKYQPQLKKEVTVIAIPPRSVTQLFQEFSEHKAKAVDRRTLEKYRALESRLSQFFGDHVAELGEAAALKFIEFLKDHQQPRTIKDRLSILNACWQWACKAGKVSHNPWKEICFKTPPKQQPRPFTRAEILAILEAFKTGSYSHYANYVEFLFLTGTRTAEAIGLRWRHVADDFSSIWIGESITRGGKQKSTKTNRDRVFPCNTRLAQFLEAIKPATAQADDLVFPAPNGNPISDNNFCKRAWAKSLEVAGVPYRKPYNTRHTFISHCLAGGMNPVELAAVTGHDVQTLYRSYAGVVSSRPKIPTIF
ncbi:tyrosine-type recombinase/integrase [Microcoleus sp. FACHB-672]|uniref:tyrosine-type recombinase/integrase n=1 Tax=Microcoleus sp. FACHB-672 TaxID=2692825 RepID=UPI001682343B|nr:tyrosine-type recombinase/integrase [Microcoleus sp. FACHB-672]MBD2039689.1 tyrosine-type recombinase/integrase [Microcoleus sp. FACHB-672]